MSSPEAPSPPVREAPARPPSIDAQGDHRTLHPDDVRGRFITGRRVVYALLIAVYLGVPFLTLGGHPLIHLDIAGRRFYLFGGAFNAQDVPGLVFLIGAFAFGLLFFTAWLGRLWCGWACPQTVFLEGVYRWIERLIDGPGRERRKAQSQGRLRLPRLLLKQAIYLAISLILAHAFLAYFVPVADLASMVIHGPAGHGFLFGWAIGTTALLMFNFAWFREQMCLVVCPYGRFQSALLDEHSLVIGYDLRRGEPRGKLRRGKSLPVVGGPTSGDCIDCRRCVVVCPTGIDIRDGLQMECIACAQCIDACDEVMDKIGRSRGLVRYDSTAGFSGLPRRILRPRVIVYGLLVLAAGLALLATATLRRSFEANLIRTGGAPYVLDQGSVRNGVEIHLINKHSAPADFTIEAIVPPGVTTVIPQPTPHLATLESARLPIFLTAERDHYHGPFEFQVVVKDRGSGVEKRITGRFLGPPR